jgi:hypothetical protein
MSGQFNKQINLILKKCKESELSDSFFVFGSISKGVDTPGDIDLVVNLEDQYFNDEAINKFNFLLKYGNRKFIGVDGLLDPFVLFKESLFVRNERCNAWIPSKNSKKLIKEIKSSSIQIKNINELPILENQWVPSAKKIKLK